MDLEVESDDFVGWTGRPIKCEINVLSKPEGSCIFSQGGTVVMAALYGPHEIKHGKIQTEETPAFQMSYRSKKGPPSNESRSLEELIKTACESVVFTRTFARHELTLVVQEMQNCGGILSCAINAGCLAMINSGVDMQHLVLAVTACLTNDNRIVVDPDESQLKSAKMSMEVAFDSELFNVIMVNSQGTSSVEEYQNTIGKCRESARILKEYFKSVVKKYAEALL
ncbi:Exosome complex [Nesidiocoris tenuis]|uniref:Exosome complex n=1 Tax=Nesidiocoris tenuis TaxID=355587 RepID=A0ABN7ASG4_9HEMI|nr:Exosome complex [Nesidiocoris tenuis]